MLALAERGDLGGMSFGFMVPKGGEEWDGEKRTLLKVDLKEISVVPAWPAYPDTSLALRSRQQARSARVALLREITLAELRA